MSGACLQHRYSLADTAECLPQGQLRRFRKPRHLSEDTLAGIQWTLCWEEAVRVPSVLPSFSNFFIAQCRFVTAMLWQYGVHRHCYSTNEYKAAISGQLTLPQQCTAATNMTGAQKRGRCLKPNTYKKRTYTCTHTPTHAHTHTHLHMHTHTPTHAHTHTHMHAHAHTYTCTRTHTHAHTPTHAHIYTYTHTHTHTHAHTHICMHMHAYRNLTHPMLAIYTKFRVETEGQIRRYCTLLMP